MADGASVGLTGGTTTTEVARVLASRNELTVVTNALNIAAELAVRPNLKLVVTGGVARSASYELVGPLADATLQGIYVDLAFVGVDGIDAARGLTTQNEVEAATNRGLIAAPPVRSWWPTAPSSATSHSPTSPGWTPSTSC